MLSAGYLKPITGKKRRHLFPGSFAGLASSPASSRISLQLIGGFHGSHRFPASAQALHGQGLIVPGSGKIGVHDKCGFKAVQCILILFLLGQNHPFVAQSISMSGGDLKDLIEALQRLIQTILIGQNESFVVPGIDQGRIKA